MTAIIIFLNVIFATAVVAGMVALHGWAIVTEHRAHHGTNPLRGILRVRPTSRRCAGRASSARPPARALVSR